VSGRMTGSGRGLTAENSQHQGRHRRDANAPWEPALLVTLRTCGQALALRSRPQDVGGVLRDLLSIKRGQP